MNTTPKQTVAALTALIVFSYPATAQEPVFNDTVNIDQQAFYEKKAPNDDYTLTNPPPYTHAQVLKSGLRFFSAPYQIADGWGEGPEGPRATQREALYPYTTNFPLLRINGLDSQSCFECHLSIGVEDQGDDRVLSRKKDATSGAAGIGSNAFINDEFPTRLTKFIRNPPHTFGSGYIEELAGEMTSLLHVQRESVQQRAKADPGIPKSIDLEAKGIRFGTLTSTFSTAKGQTFEDYSAVIGVSDDLIIRPFQWKGIASDIRNFTTGALDFHFSIQPVEKFAYIPVTNEEEKEEIEADPLKQLFAKPVHEDGDKDQKKAEISIGNVTALTTFVGMLRPPVEEDPKNPAEKETIDLGRNLFMGDGSTRIPETSKMCAECHVPSLTLKDSLYVVELPKIEVRIEDSATEESLIRALEAPSIAPDEGRTVPRPSKPGTPTLINPVPRENLPIQRELDRFRSRSTQQGQALNGPAEPEIFRLQSAEAINEAFVKMEPATKMPFDSAYAIDLNIKETAIPEDDPIHPYIFPRLKPDEETGKLEIPLYSDLKTHDMGIGLTDASPQNTDTTGVEISPRWFLTRPLWGVADTSPYMHDGRALSLYDAILAHAIVPTGKKATKPDENNPKKTVPDLGTQTGDEIAASQFAKLAPDLSSEAEEAVRIFRNQLTPEERKALIAFLSTLKLPSSN